MYRKIHHKEKPSTYEKNQLNFEADVTSEEGLSKCKMHKKNFTRSSSFHIQKSAFRCDICGTIFTCEASLKSHQLDHKGKEPSKCEVCLKALTSKDALLAHYSTHNEEDLDLFEVHVDTDDVKQFVCKLCDMTFVAEVQLVVHYRSHIKTNSFNCPLCRKILSSKKRLIPHLVRHRIVCEICGKESKTKSTLHAHYLTHTVEEYEKCGISGKTFINQSSLQALTHTRKMCRVFKCSVCGIEFNRKTSMNRHHLIFHSKNKPHKCEVCGEEFTFKSLLQLHYMKHQGQNLDMIKSISGSKTFKCHICDVTFAVEVLLILHFLTHMCIKKGSFKCQLCHKKLSSKPRLTFHLISHNKKENHLATGIKNRLFKCEICELEFKSKLSLGIHYRTHMGEKFCKKEFLECETFGDSVSSTSQCDLSQSSIKEPDESQNTAVEQHHVRLYNCKLCEKFFSSERAFNDHFIIHTREVSENSQEAFGEVVLSNQKRNSNMTEIVFSSQSDMGHHCKSFEGVFLPEVRVCRVEEHVVIQNEREIQKCEVIDPSVLSDFQSTVEGVDQSENTEIVPKLEEHRASHTPFICKLCDLRFSSETDLLRHDVVHTSQTSEEFEIEILQQLCIKIEVFKCDICGEEWPSQLELDNHCAMHLEVVSIHCKVCGATFRSETDLKNHCKIHPEEKPSKCSICRDAFLSYVEMKNHFDTHSKNVSQFKCRVCADVFSSEILLTNHLVTHSKDALSNCDNYGE